MIQNLSLAIQNLKVTDFQETDKGKFVYFTIQNRDTKEHRSFRFEKQGKDAKFAPGAIVAQMLIGADNETNYQGFGFVNCAHISLWKKYSNGSQYAKIARLIEATVLNSHHSDQYEVIPFGKCYRCARTLSTPESVKTGLGEICAEKLGVTYGQSAEEIEDDCIASMETDQNLES